GATLSHKGERGNVSAAQANRYAPPCHMRGGRSVGHLRGGARSGDRRAEDHNLARDRHAGRRVSALRRRSRRGRQPDGCLAPPRAAQHQGQHREHSAARGGDPRPRPGGTPARLRAAHGDRPAAPAPALWGGGAGWPGFTAMAQAGGRFLAPDADEPERIRDKHPFLKALTVPAGSYPGQDAEIHSVGSWSFILARPTLSDDIAYRLARALDRAEDALGKKLPQARETTAANTLAAAPSLDLIHPGVLRYLREIGLAK